MLARERAAKGAMPRTATDWAAAKVAAEERAKALKAARKQAKLREAAAVPEESEASLREERDALQKPLQAKLTEVANLKRKVRAWWITSTRSGVKMPASSARRSCIARSFRRCIPIARLAILRCRSG